jgi:hypothetical protein
LLSAERHSPATAFSIDLSAAAKLTVLTAASAASASPAANILGFMRIPLDSLRGGNRTRKVRLAAQALPVMK